MRRLFSLIESGDAPGPLTDNWMHLTPLGYRVAARIMLDDLGLAPEPWYDGLAATARALLAQERSLLDSALREVRCLEVSCTFPSDPRLIAELVESHL
ncbi:MAG: hypothetical protein KY463_06730 [Actinobacteria bacterium]|nr:hypothetical protein [Actinomycetota bacterium]